MKYVVAFDISNSKKRKAVTKACEELGFRVQRSVFEIFIDSAKLEDFSEKLLGIINHEHDTIRLYPIDRENDRNIVIIGTGKPIQQLSYAII